MATKKSTTKKAPAAAAKPAPAKKDDRVLIVIPFLASEAQGTELRFCIEGWRRHFKTPYRIAVVGDDPKIQGDDITYIPCPRVAPIAGQYLPHLDINHKFKVAREHFPDTRGFIFCCDDYYAVNDFDLSMVQYPKNMGTDITGDRDSSNGFKVDKYKTRLLLEKAGLPKVNWTTHLPQWLEWDKLETIWKAYDMEHNSLVFEDLYFNTYQGTLHAINVSNIDNDNIKCGVYRENARLEYIDRAFRDKIWINNSTVGWIPYLEQKLREHYGTSAD